MGLDTETVNGRAQLLTDGCGGHCHPQSFDDCVAFICRPDAIGWFYNLKYDAQAIIKWVEPELWLELHETGRFYTSVNGQQCRVSYIPQKMLTIKIGKQVFKFFDLAQYYERKPLTVSAEKYLGDKKRDSSSFDMSNVTIEYCYDPVFIDYALHDAKLCQQLADLFVRKCRDMGLMGNNFSSPASLSYYYFQSKTRIPTINKFIEKDHLIECLEMAWNTISGAFISVFKKGYFPSVHVYDINSSYPTRMAKLPDLDNGKFFMDDGQPSSDYYMGWMKCRVAIEPGDDGFYHPAIPIMRKNKSNIYPVGVFDTWLTLSEYRHYSRFHAIKPIIGLYWVPSIMSFPFKNEIERIYSMRKQPDIDDMTNLFLKIVLNGLYGKTLQKNQVIDPDDDLFGWWKTGPMFNPFYASYILADARIAVHDQLLKIDPSNIIAVFTDSIISKTALPIRTSEKLGDWSLDKKGEALVIGCGVYSIKTDKGVKTKLRGLKNSKVDLFQVVAEQYHSSTLDITSLLNISIATSLIQNRADDMNKLVNIIKSIDINFDTKRLWFDDWQTAGDIMKKPPIDSNPILKGLDYG